jgi:hypothetical protein
MDPALLLFLLRVASALVLLAFLGGVVFLLVRDLQTADESQAVQERVTGYVEVRISADPPTRHPLRPVTTIGRAPTNQIVLDNSYTSSRHALITRRGRQWWLEDLKSRNGTLLNDLPLTEPTVITPADSITIGDVHLRIETLS